MPPQRTIPPSKVLKTERSHEENQERAYIAASRRSDRSLEARVESARRASEIHKRRTGRSLRVTEQDVVNEEMYEEEDDDMPLPYRRLTAHLQTGSADFNKRLSAYLTNHVAMRSALDQAITNSYAQQYPNAPQFAHNSMYSSPFLPNVMPQHQSPQTYGQPYPSPGTPGYRPNHPSRSASFSHGPASYSPSDIPVASPTQSLPQLDRRKTSASSKSSSQSPHGAPATPNSLQSRTSVQPTSSAYNATHENRTSQHMKAPPNPQPQPHQHSFDFAGRSHIAPFSTTLPPESQIMLGSSLDPNDPMTSMLMAGSENLPQPYNYIGSPQKTQSFAHGHGGMSATLAPSALDMSLNTMSNTSSAPVFPGFDGNLPDPSKNQFLPGYSSAGGSGTATPGGIDSGWDAFINEHSWAENAT